MESAQTGNRWYVDIKFIEQGDIYFFYKPKKGLEKISGKDDVARFFFVLDPDGTNPSRYIVLGNKKMPELKDGGKTNWGFIQIVGGRGFKTSNKPKATVKNASRPIGEGIYSIINHRNHTHLLYSLELPKKIGEVQEEFSIREEGNYIFMERSIENSPRTIEEPFSNFSSVTIKNLNRRGTEILLIGVGADLGRLGVKAQKDDEDIESADIFSKLELDKRRHPTYSLISGKWER